MKSQKILTYPNPSLLEVSKSVKYIDKETHKFIDLLHQSLYSTTGVGLSAPQIGINKRIIIVDPSRYEDNKESYTVLINPEIVYQSGEYLSKSEGCKSFPGLRVNINRHEIVHVKYLDSSGNEVLVKAKGFEAAVLQHEIDHLNGIVLIDHVDAVEKPVYKLYALNLADISKRVDWLKTKSNGVLFRQSGKNENQLVVKDDNQIILYFTENCNTNGELKLSGIMSRIDIYNPLNLLGIYTQAMMLTLVLNRNPKRLYMLGFGGGRIPMIFHHYFQELFIDGSEIDQKTAMIASKYFGIKCDKRLNFSVREGRQHLEEIKDRLYDIILIDCYTGTGNHPYTLSTIEFYDLCKSRLTSTGVVATNLIDSDPLFKEKVNTFRSAFKYSYDFMHKGAHVYFGSNSISLSENDFLEYAIKLDEKYKFVFPFVERAQNVKQLSGSIRNEEILHDKAISNDNFKEIAKDDPIFRGIGRNDLCPCGSGKKYKKCHL